MSYSSVILADSPTGFWRLGETTGTSIADSSTAGTNTGTANATGLTYAQTGALTGDANTAILFDGAAGKITLPNMNTASSSTASLEVWVKFTTTSATEFFFYSEGSTTNSLPIWGLSTGSSTDSMGGGVQLYHRADGGFAVYKTSSRIQYNDGNWHHVVGVRNNADTSQGTNGSYYLYVDGALEKASGSIYPMTTTVDKARIGVLGRAADANFFGGTMDEMAVYTSALTQDQVTAHYIAGTTLNPKFKRHLSGLGVGT